ncbi:hypothetical protein THAOC_04590 [Thalassiosira oceanica]|uniref:Uncharacterized protein n=1 Tax=Thalassiosira oceanica TaxID=159749 RepID=K0TIX6_THAOC|nr:hypothetical protein THAOC_04590 [Thalassiosira oceanica]|eukprot:EJK73766.1 hypothetical protein THAOC_04590 [Thalassiosira oceanica]
MSSIDVPEDVLLIDAAALRERDIPSGVVHVRLASDVSELPNMAFKGCSSLKSVEFNEGLVRIGGHGVFMDCSRLVRVYISHGVERIFRNAFKNCSSLVTINIPPSISFMMLDKNIFVGCSSLTNVYFQYSEEFNVRVALDDTPLRPIRDWKPLPLDRRGMLRTHERIDKDLRDEFNFAKRFDQLQLHLMCFFYPYPWGLEDISDEIMNDETSAGKVDCFKMSPLHILACGNSDNPETRNVYELLIERNPSALTAPDRWGRFPLHYAITNEATPDVLEILFRETIARQINDGPGSTEQTLRMISFELHRLIRGVVQTPKVALAFITDLAKAALTCPPELQIGWKRLVVEMIVHGIPRETLQTIVRISVDADLKALDPQRQEVIESMIREIPERQYGGYTQSHHSRIKITNHVEKLWGLISFWQLREASTLLELALWKAKIDDADEGADRELCRVNSGSVFVMKGVLQYFEYPWWKMRYKLKTTQDR